MAKSNHGYEASNRPFDDSPLSESKDKQDEQIGKALLTISEVHIHYTYISMALLPFAGANFQNALFSYVFC